MYQTLNKKISVVLDWYIYGFLGNTRVKGLGLRAYMWMIVVMVLYVL